MCFTPEGRKVFGGVRKIMKNYYLQLAGLRAVLRTPGRIIISPHLQPFLCEAHEQTDCAITVQECSCLPAPSVQGVWHGLEYYDRTHRAMRVFHCSAPQVAAFAVTELFDDGDIQISVLPEYLNYFSGSAGIFNRIGMETLLLQHKGLLLHASLIEYNGQGIAFTGPSGIGKSTQAALWQTHLNAQILNGDRAALRKQENQWIAYGSPYAGTSGIYENKSVPLSCIVVLRQAQKNRLQRLSALQTLSYLYPELSIHHWDRAFAEPAMDLCLKLINDTPVYLLECLPNEDAVRLLQKGLSL